MDSYLNTERLPPDRYQFMPSNEEKSRRIEKLQQLRTTCPETWIEKNRGYDNEKKE